MSEIFVRKLSEMREKSVRKLNVGNETFSDAVIKSYQKSHVVFKKNSIFQVEGMYGKIRKLFDVEIKTISSPRD